MRIERWPRNVEWKAETVPFSMNSCVSGFTSAALSSGKGKVCPEWVQKKWIVVNVSFGEAEGERNTRLMEVRLAVGGRREEQVHPPPSLPPWRKPLAASPVNKLCWTRAPSPADWRERGGSPRDNAAAALTARHQGTKNRRRWKKTPGCFHP